MQLLRGKKACKQLFTTVLLDLVSTFQFATIKFIYYFELNSEVIKIKCIAFVVHFCCILIFLMVCKCREVNQMVREYEKDGRYRKTAL